MARLFTGGGETKQFTSEGFGVLGGAPTFDTATKHTGAASFKTVGNQYFRFNSVSASGKTVFARAWVNFSAWTTAASGYCTVITYDGSAAAGAGVNKTGVLSAGTYPGTGTTITGVGATAQLALNTWYMIEAKVILTSTTYTTLEVRLNGTIVSTNTISNALTDGHIYFGDQDGAGGATVYFDDWAVNDSTGASQTGYPGDGRTYLLLGTADSSRTGFTAGAGGTTSLDAAVNHVPAAGVVLASATNTSQIKDTVSNITDNYVVTLQTPTAAGVPAGATVTVAQAIAMIGNSSVTSRSLGLTGVSNPAITEALGATGTTAAATYPTGWTFLPTLPVYAPSVTFGSAPTLKIRKNTASTDAAMSCLMGLILEVVPAGVSVSATQGSAASVLRTVTRAKALTQAQSTAVLRAVARAKALTQASVATLGTVDSISQFTDAFASSASLTANGQTYGTNWAADDIVTETITIGSGLVTLPVTANYPGLIGTAVWSMVGGAAFVTMTPPAVGNGSRQVFLRVYSGFIGSSNYVDWIWQDAGGSFLYVEYNDGSGNNDSMFNVAVTAAAPVRVRFRESAGTIFWDYDTGSGWTNAASKTAASMGFDPGNCVPGLFAGYYGTESASNAVFSNFDIATTNIPQAISATQASAAVLVRSVARVKVLTQGQAAVIARVAGAVRAASQAQSGVVARSAARKVTASQAQAAVRVGTPARSSAATQAQSGVAHRTPVRVTAATQAQGAVFGVRSLARTAAASQAQAATFGVRSMSRSAVASQAQTATPARSVTRSVAATQAQAAVVVRAGARSVTASQGQSAVAHRTPGPTRTATQAQSAVAARTPARVVTGSQAQTATVRHSSSTRTVSATQSQTATLTRAMTRAVSATQPQAATANRTPGAVRAVTQAQAATYGTRSLTRTVAGAQTSAGVSVRAVARSVSCSQAQSSTRLSGKPVEVSTTQGQSAVFGVRSLTRSVTVSQPHSAVVARAMTRALAATQAQAAVLVRAVARTFAASQGQSALAQAGRPRLLSASQAQSARAVRGVVRGVAALQGQAAAVVRAAARTFVVTQAQAATVARAGARTLTVSQSRSVSVTGARAAVRSAAQAQSATVRHGALTRAVTATQSQAPVSVRAVARAGSCSLTAVATQQHGRPRVLTVSQASSVSRPPTSIARGVVVAVVHVPVVARAFARSFAPAVLAAPAAVKAPARRLSTSQGQTGSVQHSKPVAHSVAQGQAVVKVRGVGRRAAAAAGALAVMSRVVPRFRTRSASQGQGVSLRRAAARGVAAAQPHAVSVLGSVPRAHSVAQASAAVSVRTILFPRYSNPTVTVARRVAAPARRSTAGQSSAARSARTPTRVSTATQPSSVTMAGPKGSVRLATQATAATRREQLVRGLAALQAAAAKVTRLPARISAATSPTGVVRVANVGRRPAATQASIVVCHVEIVRAPRAVQGQGAVRVARPNRVLRPWTVPLVGRQTVVLAVRASSVHHTPVVGQSVPRPQTATQASNAVRRVGVSATRSAASGSSASVKLTRFPVRFVRAVGVPAVARAVSVSHTAMEIHWATRVTALSRHVATSQHAGAASVRNVGTKLTSSQLSSSTRRSAVLLSRGVGQHTAAGKVRGISVRRAAVQHAFAVNVPAKPIGGGETGVLSFGFTGIARDEGVETGVLSDGYTGIVSG